jgi:hypothetical protein
MPMFMTACLAIRIGLTAIRDVLRGRNSTSMESSTRWIQELSPALRFGLKNEKSRRVKTPGGVFQRVGLLTTSPSRPSGTALQLVSEGHPGTSAWTGFTVQVEEDKLHAASALRGVCPAFLATSPRRGCEQISGIGFQPVVNPRFQKRN